MLRFSPFLLGLAASLLCILDSSDADVLLFLSRNLTFSASILSPQSIRVRSLFIRDDFDSPSHNYYFNA